jgi:NAD(P)-dependent dehydrogenase (short-subunit alcohol dehydrogenase family)
LEREMDAGMDPGRTLKEALEGKHVMITGASSGIGRAAAAAFVAAGASVLAVARSVDKLDALARELGGPPRAVPLAAEESLRPCLSPEQIGRLSRLLIEVQIVFWTIGGAGVLTLAIADAWRRRDAD